MNFILFGVLTRIALAKSFIVHVLPVSNQFQAEVDPDNFAAFKALMSKLISVLSVDSSLKFNLDANTALLERWLIEKDASPVERRKLQQLIAN